MRQLSGKVVEAQAVAGEVSDTRVGHRLRELRVLAGLTQIQLAARLGIGQTALSRLENRADVRISTLKDYVEALGASLRVDATFDKKSATALRIIDLFEDARVDDDQLILPIIPEEVFKPRRDVILSIKPLYTSLILERRKTVELRRRFPTKMPNGTLAFIYSTTPDRAIVGTAQIKNVTKKPIAEIWSKFSKPACVKKADFEDYFAGLDDGYVLQFENARSLRRIVSLQELRERFSFEPPQSFLYAKPVLREALSYERTDVPH